MGGQQIVAAVVLVALAAAGRGGAQRVHLDAPARLFAHAPPTGRRGAGDATPCLLDQGWLSRGPSGGAWAADAFTGELYRPADGRGLAGGLCAQRWRADPAGPTPVAVGVHDIDPWAVPCTPVVLGVVCAVRCGPGWCVPVDPALACPVDFVAGRDDAGCPPGLALEDASWTRAGWRPEHSGLVRRLTPAARVTADPDTPVAAARVRLSSPSWRGVPPGTVQILGAYANATADAVLPWLSGQVRVVHVTFAPPWPLHHATMLSLTLDASAETLPYRWPPLAVSAVFCPAAHGGGCGWAPSDADARVTVTRPDADHGACHTVALDVAPDPAVPPTHVDGGWAVELAVSTPTGWEQARLARHAANATLAWRLTVRNSNPAGTAVLHAVTWNGGTATDWSGDGLLPAQDHVAVAGTITPVPGGHWSWPSRATLHLAIPYGRPDQFAATTLCIAPA